ncbi:hypothetical protein DFH11DRAFT_1504755 [Phellopilus nigrolimitatus]|nr:hypothetical protein DFH11DRAFT_1504755 [Phellopilus nigrolimitatus]
MYSPQRLDSPPPLPHFRRPWSPLELESYNQNATPRQLRESSDASFEALDLADYAMTLYPANNMRTGAYSSFARDRQYPEYPATPPRSFSLASRGSYLSPPSLVSGGSSSSRSRGHSPRLDTPTRRPFSLPTPRLPQLSNNSNTGHTHSYPWIVENHSIVEAGEIDLSTFPEWSRDWYKSQKDRHNISNDPYSPIANYDPDMASPLRDEMDFSFSPYTSANGSHRNVLPWSVEDERLEADITPELKKERLRLLEKEFGSNSTNQGDWREDTKLLGSVDAKGNIITAGPKKRIITRWVQGTFALGTAIASLYSALLLKPIGSPPPRGTVPAYLLYFLSVITVLLVLYMFMFRPCCCAGKRTQNMAQNGPAGMMVLPVQGLPGADGKKKKNGKDNKRKRDEPGSVQVNLIVDPSMFSSSGVREGRKVVDEEAGMAPALRGKRRGLLEGLAMEQQWELARKQLKRLLFFDIALFFLWGAEFIVILLGKRCPASKFEGWCDGYNVATALSSFLCITFGLSVFYDVKDLHMSKASPRTRT